MQTISEQIRNSNITTRKQRKIAERNVKFNTTRYGYEGRIYRRIEMQYDDIGGYGRRTSHFRAIIENHSDLYNKGYTVRFYEAASLLETKDTASYSFAKDTAENMLLEFCN